MKERGAGWFLAPALAGAVALVALPAVATLALAFVEWDGLRAPHLAGLENFRRLAGDNLFWISLRNSLIFAGLAVPVRLGLALGVGLLVSPRRRGVASARAAVILPTFIPDVAYALVWLWLLNPLYGPIAGVLRGLGLPGTEWLLGPWGARTSVVVMSAFQIAEAIVVIAAVRNEIPGELYEAAAIEGAPARRVFRAVTLPVLAPILFLLAARDVALGLQASFVPALVLTGGGPEYATTFLPLYTYQTAFEYLRFGQAAAATLASFAITGVTVVLAAFALRRTRVLGSY